MIATVPSWVLSATQISTNSRPILLLEAGLGMVFGFLAYIILIKFSLFRGCDLIIVTIKNILVKNKSIDEN
jgi:hypothetical protein